VLALTSDKRPPGWCLESLTQLPEEMKSSDRTADQLERRVVDLAEAVALEHHVGETFNAVVVNVSKRSATIQLRDPAVLTQCKGAGLELGSEIAARLVDVDPVEGRITFEA
jgi:exoribonuclease R